MLQPSEIDAIAEATANIIVDRKRAHWVDPEVHAEHHSWVAEKLVHDRERAEFWRTVRARVISSAMIWAAPILIAAVAYASWEWFIDRVRDGVGS